MAAIHEDTFKTYRGRHGTEPQCGYTISCKKVSGSAGAFLVGYLQSTSAKQSDSPSIRPRQPGAARCELRRAATRCSADIGGRAVSVTSIPPESPLKSERSSRRQLRMPESQTRCGIGSATWAESERDRGVYVPLRVRVRQNSRRKAKKLSNRGFTPTIEQSDARRARIYDISLPLSLVSLSRCAHVS